MTFCDRRFTRQANISSDRHRPIKMSAKLAVHQHGKSKVRVGRVWREGSKHYFVEWNVDVMLESDMAHAFKNGDNTDMTTTDTTKNTVRFLTPILGYKRGNEVKTKWQCASQNYFQLPFSSLSFVLGAMQVYYVAKQCSSRCSAEEYAIALGKHFCKVYPLVRIICCQSITRC